MRAHGNIPELMNIRPPLGLDKLGNSYRILVVDDSSTIRRLVSQMLRSEAFEVCGEATNGEEAVAMYKELCPDAVTLDVNMPKMSGEEALEHLLEYDKDVRIVMITSEGHKETVIKMIKSGARGYVVKPFKKGNLCQKVKDAIES